MKHVVVLALAAAACAPQVSAMTVTGLPVDEAAVRHIAAAVGVDPNTIDLDVVPSYFDCSAPGAEGTCAGLSHPETDGRWSVKVGMVLEHTAAATTDINCTALIHEFYHVLLGGDAGHTTPGVWGRDGKVESLHKALNCPYVQWNNSYSN